MPETKNILDFKHPNYKGVWISKLDFGLFYIWLKKGNTQLPLRYSGKCWENYEGLVESNIYDLKIEETKVFFRKEYLTDRPDLLEEIIHYNGQRKNNSELFRGIWTSINSDGVKIRGPFYMTDSSANEKCLAQILHKLNTKNFERKLTDFQKEYPFVPLI
jgi:hypothetical protein